MSVQSFSGTCFPHHFHTVLLGADMARTKRSANFGSRTQRLKLAAGVPHEEPLSPGRYIVYRRPLSGAAGIWKARLFINPKAKPQVSIGVADDYQDANGQTILNYAQAQAKAIAWFEQITRQVREDDGELIKRASLTVKDVMAAYYQDAQRRGMKSLTRSMQSTNAWVVSALGDVEVSKLTRTKLERWLDSVAKSGRRVRTKPGREAAFAPEPVADDEKRMRKESANKVWSIFRAALNFALDRRLISVTNPCWRDVKPFKGTKNARTRFLTIDEQVRLVNVCPPDFRRLVRGALLTGCRYEELSLIKCKDYNPNAKTPTVFIAESKNGKSRYVYLAKEGAELFDELTADGTPDSYVFTRDNVARRKRVDVGDRWAKGDQRRFMAAACKAAGLEILDFHELRHTYASVLVNSGCPLPVVAAQLGHSDTRMVEQHYGHLAPSYVADMVNEKMPTLGILEPTNIEKLKPTKVVAADRLAARAKT